MRGRCARRGRSRTAAARSDKNVRRARLGVAVSLQSPQGQPDRPQGDNLRDDNRRRGRRGDGCCNVDSLVAVRNKRKIARSTGARAAEIRAHHRARYNGHDGEHARARLYRLGALLRAPHGHLQQQCQPDTQPRADRR